MGQQTLVEFGEYPEIIADELGDVRIIGDQLHIVLSRWRRVDGIYQLCIVGEVIRPLSKARNDLITWDRIIGATAEAPVPQPRLLRH